MIKANELRIGNWLYGHNPGSMSHRQEGFFQVENIEEDRINVWRVPGFEDESAKASHIPLTPEMLKKLGFINIGTDDFHNSNLWSIPDSNYKYCEGGWIVDNAGYYGHFCDIGHGINNLHNLQNLFFLLEGKELNIQL